MLFDIDRQNGPVESADFEEVLCAWAWWDCPRSGVAPIQGKPYRFLCEFSEELDDYPAEFHLWPITDDQLEGELGAWSLWVDWRGRFDRGGALQPFEHDPNVRASLSRLQAYVSPPSDALLAIPEWELDRNRSFSGRVPKHRVRWRPPRPDRSHCRSSSGCCFPERRPLTDAQPVYRRAMSSRMAIPGSPVAFSSFPARSAPGSRWGSSAQ
jgi:hypothetical protein